MRPKVCRDPTRGQWQRSRAPLRNNTMTSAVPRAMRFAGVPLPPSRRAEHTMGMPQATHHWTPDDVRTLPDDGRRYEVVAGELLVTPAPSFAHQEAVRLLIRALGDHVEHTGIRPASTSPADPTPRPAPSGPGGAASSNEPGPLNTGSWPSRPAWWSDGGRPTSGRRC